MKYILAAVLVSLACAAAVWGAASDNLKAFPPAEKGMTRHVLMLPQEPDESVLKVQILIGKTVELDPNNRYFFGGKLETRTAQGWGFNYYVLPKLGPMGGTRMAVDPNVPKVSRFITLGGDELLVRYNSKLPLVIYVPEGGEVRYRVWRTTAESSAVNPG